MPNINQLSGLSQLSSGDLLPVYVPNNGDARKVSVGQLLQFFQQQFASPTLSTQFATPGTGFNVAVQTPVSEQQWLILQPAGTLAVGTVTLPLNTQTPDGTEVLITTTQVITTFTLALNGAAAAYGAPTTLAANGFFRVRFYAATNSWYRIA
jgi:hypothetical protein